MAMRLELPRNVAERGEGQEMEDTHSILFRGQRVMLQHFRDWKQDTLPLRGGSPEGRQQQL